MAEAARSWAEAAASMLLTGVAALLVLLAGLAIVFILPTILMIVLMGYESGPAGGIGNWLFLVWFPLAFAAAIYSLVAGLGAVNEPGLGKVARLLLVAILVFFSFPPFLFPMP